MGRLREDVYRANMALHESGLVIETFGNVSGIDRDTGVFFIKPSGVPYSELSPDNMVPVSLDTGAVLEGRLRPSSDTPTHLELYRAFECGGIAHTHSAYATAFAQARRPIPCMGTTHADYFRKDIPVTRPLTRAEVDGDYERNTGVVIVEAFASADLHAAEVPAVLVANHGPFTWGPDAMKATEHARIVEHLARMEFIGAIVNADADRPADFLAERHHRRKHGGDAYYGQG